MPSTCATWLRTARSIAASCSAVDSPASLAVSPSVAAAASPATRRAGRTRPESTDGSCSPRSRSRPRSSRAATSSGGPTAPPAAGPGWSAALAPDRGRPAVTAASSSARPSSARQRSEPGPNHALPVLLAQLAGHPVGLRPGTPGQRGCGQAQLAPVRGKRVEERVRRRVAALPGAAHDPGGGGEQHERAEVASLGQLVQVPCARGLGPHDGGQPRGSQRPDHPIV